MNREQEARAAFISFYEEREGALGAHKAADLRAGSFGPDDLRAVAFALAFADQQADQAGEALKEAAATIAAQQRLLGSVLAAIETGRSEPLFIARDTLKNYIADNPPASRIGGE